MQTIKMLLLVLPLLFGAKAQLQCGTYAQTDQLMRICFELETQSRSFCVANTQRSSTERFAASVTAADRAIVIEYSALANAAGMFGTQAQTCIDLWRRARCAAAFPLTSDASVCESTCARLDDCHAQFFHLDACVFPDKSPDCVDVTTNSECVVLASAPPLPVRPQPGAPRSPARGAARSAAQRLAPGMLAALFLFTI
jgi:hypothetical protein